MKYLFLALCSFLFAQESMAGASFSIQNVIYKDLVPRPLVGLSIDQKVQDKLFVTAWAGLGSRPDKMESDEAKHWSSMKLGLDYRFERISFGGGMLMNAVSEDWEKFYPQIANAEKEYAAYLKMSIKLW